MKSDPQNALWLHIFIAVEISSKDPLVALQDNVFHERSINTILLPS
jgi:hypothetical protein